MWLFLGYSSIGRLIRAAADDSEMLSALGVNVRLLYTIVFGVGSVLAALGGVLSGPLRSIYPGMGTSVIIDSFIVLVIGGLGSVGGAVAGSLILGVVKALALLGFPDLEESLPFMVMALLLVVRPHGLFGKPG
jgi:branched-chain amino acid transport system permease protein